MSVSNQFEDENVDLSRLEDEMMTFLLVEAITQRKAEIYENVVFEGKKRYYIEDLSQRDYRLENTTPYQISIAGHAISATAWGKMLCETVNFLLEQNPLTDEQLLAFRTEWTKSVIFSVVKKTNFKLINNGLYLNCNHTALHSCWLLQDILNLFSVDVASTTLLIHRPCSAEPANVRDYIEKRFKNGMLEYLVINQQLSEENAHVIINIISTQLNAILATISRSYTNFFLFDDSSVLHNYAKNVREKIAQTSNINADAKELLNLALDYLLKYFKHSTY